jgi:hypothetical protein
MWKIHGDNFRGSRSTCAPDNITIANEAPLHERNVPRSATPAYLDIWAYGHVGKFFHRLCSKLRSVYGSPGAILSPEADRSTATRRTTPYLNSRPALGGVVSVSS